jgi:protein-disulfide isomerase
MILLAALALAAAPHSHPAHASAVAHAKAPTDWTRVASATPAGGFVMGNPAATVKLVEYGSLTCPHCRHFDETAAAPLAAYVRTGRVSWEFRPFLLSGYDIPATLTASCNGAATFFPMTHALYATQPEWVAKMQAIPADRLEVIRKLTRPEQFAAIGVAAGFPAFGAAHGVPAAKISACLRNQAAAERAVQVTADASNKFQVHGTPTFMIDGATIDYSAGPSPWAVVEAQLKSSLAKVK